MQDSPFRGSRNFSNVRLFETRVPLTSRFRSPLTGSHFVKEVFLFFSFTEKYLSNVINDNDLLSNSVRFWQCKRIFELYARRYVARISNFDAIYGL